MCGNGTLPLCKVSWSNLVWLVSYAGLIREEGGEEEEEDDSDNGERPRSSLNTKYYCT